MQPLSKSNWLELIPILISFFMLMTSLINQDIKGLIWLAFTICPFLFINWFYSKTPPCPDSILPLFSNGQSFSVSSFFIIFTLFYLLLPMFRLHNFNYYVLFSFILFYFTDIATKQRLCPQTTNSIAVFTGTLIGAIYGTACFFLLTTAGDKFLYFSTSESNNVYCSKPKNQTFKCNVYKNGQIISTL